MDDIRQGQRVPIRFNEPSDFRQHTTAPSTTRAKENLGESEIFAATARRRKDGCVPVFRCSVLSAYSYLD